MANKPTRSPDHKRAPAGALSLSPKLAPQHIVSIQQFQNKVLLNKLFKRATYFKKTAPSKYPQPLKYKIIATLFYEPSTRTRLSFETAIQRLGGQIISTENANGSSSKAKGESLADTIRTINGYADAIVLRHPDSNSACLAAGVSKVPIINAGAGSAEHPTQALLDVFTIIEQKQKLDGLNIGIVGDVLHSRTIQSLACLLSMYNVRLHLIAPKEIQASSAQLKQLNPTAKVSQHNSWNGVIEELDVLYLNRIQQERYADPKEFEKLKNSFRLTTKVMQKTKPNAIILDPLPRINEIAEDVDEDPRALYFEQAKNGLFVRMALLEEIFKSTKKVW